ncbi:MAG: CmpA/NrtA family ABC transporter substrate-binding protein [Sphingomonadales bacterium]
MSGGNLEKTELSLGFIPLVDCSILVAAHEKGFASAEGLSLALHKERNWATIRDKLNLGHFDAAHMLAGMPVSASLGIGQVQVDTIAPFVMNLNGNAITVSSDVYTAMGDAADGDLSEPAHSGAALKKVIDAYEAPLTFAMVYPFSCHNYELRYWLAAAGIDPDRDVRIVVIPPSLIAESMRAGQIDGFCVGEPWNSLAVDMGLAHIVVPKSAFWRQGPEKVLGTTAAWADAHPKTLNALLKALYKAAQWCDESANHAELAQLLTQPHYLDVPALIILRALSGDLAFGPDEAQRHVENFLIFHRQAANFPWRSQALWLYSQMVRWGQADYSKVGEDIARSCFRPDIYRNALSGLTPPPILPGASEKVEGALFDPTPAGAKGRPLVLGPDNFFDERPFDPDDLQGYLASFPTL